MQGDCLSPVLFIFYLAKVLRNEREGNGGTFLIKPKYDDDITYITDDEELYQKLQAEIPILLEEGQLKVNRTKTELFVIPKPPPPDPPPPKIEELLEHKDDKICWSALDWTVNYNPEPPEDKTPDWHKCKLLGSYLGTKNDIDNRKNLALQTLLKFENIFNSKVSKMTKIRNFIIYITSVFLYNCEMWGLTKNRRKWNRCFP